MITTTARSRLANAGQCDAIKSQLAMYFCSLYVLILPLSNRFSSRARHGRSDCHHGKIQPGQRRPRRRWFSLREYPPGRGPFVRPARTGGCCAALALLFAVSIRAQMPAQGEIPRRRLEHDEVYEDEAQHRQPYSSQQLNSRWGQIWNTFPSAWRLRGGFA